MASDIIERWKESINASSPSELRPATADSSPQAVTSQH